VLNGTVDVAVLRGPADDDLHCDPLFAEVQMYR
jgi:hypothetical protein